MSSNGSNSLRSTNLVSTTLSTLTVHLLVTHISLHRELQILVDVVVQLEHESITREVVVFHQTTIVVVCARERELGLLRTTVQTQVVAVRKNIGTEHILLPIDSPNTLVEIEVVINTIVLFERCHVAATAEERILIVRHHIVVSVHCLQALSDGLRLQITVVVNLSLTCLCTLCRDEDNTICTLRTVDSCRRSILQHSDVLNIVRRNIADARSLETIHNVQWRVITRDGTTTTHANQHFSVWRTVGRGDTHTGQLTAQCLRYTWNRHLHDVLTSYCSHRTRQVLLANCTVTNHYHVVQAMSLVL